MNFFSVSRKQKTLKLVKNLTTGRFLYVQFSSDLTISSTFILDTIVKYQIIELDEFQRQF